MLLPQACLDEATEPWGVKVERVEMYVKSITQPEVETCLNFPPVAWPDPTRPDPLVGRSEHQIPCQEQRYSAQNFIRQTTRKM